GDVARGWRRLPGWARWGLIALAVVIALGWAMAPARRAVDLVANRASLLRGRDARASWIVRAEDARRNWTRTTWTGSSRRSNAAPKRPIHDPNFHGTVASTCVYSPSVRCSCGVPSHRIFDLRVRPIIGVIADWPNTRQERAGGCETSIRVVQA